MATIVGEVTGLQQCNHPWNIPHLVKKIRGFPLKVKLFQNTATYPNSWEGLHPPPPPRPPPCTSVGVWICVYIRGLIIVAAKGEKCLFTTYKKMELRDRDLLLVLLYWLTICFSSLHFFLLFVILAGPHIAISHFPIIMNLFCFMSVLAHSKFPQN